MNDIPGWPWRPDLCPADLHYGEYLLDHSWAPVDHASPKVLHVGTGLHHHVGLLLGSHGFTVIGITVSQAEVDAYLALTNRPRGYTAYQRNIYNPAYVRMGRTSLTEDVADSMSLFHLGEPPKPQDGYRSDREVIERARTWSRELVFYVGSSAFDRIEPIIASMVAQGRMRFVTAYKSLIAYTNA